jgi:hypothetical protein
MHKQLWIGLLLASFVYGAFCASVQSQPVAQNASQPSAQNAQKTARIALVQEFVRELEVLYRLQETTKKEFSENKSGPGGLVTGIRNGTRALYEMNESIDRLRSSSASVALCLAHTLSGQFPMGLVTTRAGNRLEGDRKPGECDYPGATRREMATGTMPKRTGATTRIRTHARHGGKHFRIPSASCG